MMQLARLYTLTEQGVNIIKLVYPQVKESELERRKTEKYGEVCYVRGTDNKWYSPIEAYMVSHKKTLGSKEEFKSAINEIAQTFGLDGRGKEKKESVVDESEIEAIASKLLRIGGRWYKKAKDPQTGQTTLYDINSSSIVSDYGKEIGNMVLKVAPKYLAKTNIPSRTDYQESIDNGDGELFYNIYRPLSHTPTEGEWPHIEKLLRHIFQEQYEMGLDYLEILYEKPLHPLPVIDKQTVDTLLVNTLSKKETSSAFQRRIWLDKALIELGIEDYQQKKGQWTYFVPKYKMVKGNLPTDIVKSGFHREYEKFNYNTALTKYYEQRHPQEKLSGMEVLGALVILNMLSGSSGDSHRYSCRSCPASFSNQADLLTHQNAYDH